MLPREIFLSHSDQDRRFVSRLVKTLVGHQLPVWYSKRNIAAAQQWHDEIGAALRRCDWFIVVLTPNSVQSVWVKHELMFALNHRQFQNRIVPIVYKPCNYEALSWTLAGFQMIDFTKSFAAGCLELFRVWGLAYRPPSH